MRRQFNVFAALAVMLAAGAQEAKATANNIIQYEKGIAKDVATKQLKVTPQTNGSNPYRRSVTPKHNQRQKRKLLRQCPHLRKSKHNPL